MPLCINHCLTINCFHFNVGKMHISNIKIYDAEIKIKYSHLNQGSLTQFYLVNKDSLVECIKFLKESKEVVLYPWDTYFVVMMFM